MQTPRPLRLGLCERGEKDSRPILFVRNAPQPSVLVLVLVMKETEIKCEVLLYPRFVRLLLLVVDAWNRDAGKPEAMRGFRTRRNIGRAFGQFTNGRGAVEVATVVDYVFQIRRLIRQALVSAGIDVESERVDLIEHFPYQGYRIGPLGIKIVEPSPEDRTRTDDAHVATYFGADVRDANNASDPSSRADA